MRTLRLFLLFFYFIAFTIPPLFAQQFPVDEFLGVNLLREDPIEKAECVGFAREFHNWVIDQGKWVQNRNAIIESQDFLISYSPNIQNSYDLYDENDVGLTNSIGEFNYLLGTFELSVTGEIYPVYNFVRIGYIDIPNSNRNDDCGKS